MPAPLQKIRVHPRRPRLALLFTAALSSTATAQRNFDPGLSVNVERKAALAAKGGKALGDAGFDPTSADYQDINLYVDAPLTDAELKTLSRNGVTVSVGDFVPPVAGLHARGFYPARVHRGDLGYLKDNARFPFISSADHRLLPMNDVSKAYTRADIVQAGVQVPGRTGAGVKIAIADSGFDLTHPDFPTPIEAYDMTDGVGVANWGTNVAPVVPVALHGTHVAGTALGRGTASGGLFKGTAPQADFLAYKIGNDTNASASDADTIEAVNRAVFVGADIFSMSYGGWDTYNDGSEALPQAMDAAFAAGTLVFISAGNSRQAREHYSASVAPLASSAAFSYSVQNSSASTALTGSDYLYINWLDDSHADYNITMTCSNLTTGEILSTNNTVGDRVGTSARNVELRIYQLSVNIPANQTKTYSLTFTNSAATGVTPVVHVFAQSSASTTYFFPAADPNYTLNSPSTATNAIAVGAWVHRSSWTNYQGNSFTFGQTANALANFSSLGPRIDGIVKPDIVAPGSATISLRVPSLGTSASSIIDNDGLNLDGSGPAQYYVLQGTSMACPHAAGVAALVIEAAPLATAAEIRSAILATAGNAASPTNQVGHGMEDALAAIQLLSPKVTVEQAAAQSDPTTTAPINFTVAFSEPVTGFDAADLIVGGATGGTVSAITGAGPVYQVAVNGFTSTGAVTLSVVQGGATSVSKGAKNLNSTSADNSVTVTTTTAAGGEWRAYR